jgi:nitrogen fixation protein FixH
MSASLSAPRSAWRWFPWAMIGALGIVVVVNFGMVWAALRTFPGVAQTDVFDESNKYDAVLAEAQKEAALGWSVKAAATDARVTVSLTNRSGGALAGAQVTATALRPLGPDHTTALTFREVTPGTYHAEAALGNGQWDLRVAISTGGKTLHTTRRVVVK